MCGGNSVRKSKSDVSSWTGRKFERRTSQIIMESLVFWFQSTGNFLENRVSLLAQSCSLTAQFARCQQYHLSSHFHSGSLQLYQANITAHRSFSIFLWALRQPR